MCPMPIFMQAVNQVIGLAMFLVLLAPCVWLASTLVIALMRDIKDLRPQ